MPDRRVIGPLFGIAIAFCILGGVYINAPGAAIAGWNLALLLAVLWLTIDLRARRHNRDSRLR